MSRGVRVRLAAFLVLSALGIVYVAGSYLGFVDRILGRGYTIHATLPSSGGLFEGSEVTYRGVKVGKVSAMRVHGNGLQLDLAMQDGTRIPMDSQVFVHNLSAVGEQYLDLVPPDANGPYAAAGATLHGTAQSLPVDEGDLLVQLDQFVESVDKRHLQVVVHELGTMFDNTGVPLQKLIDDGGHFIDVASAHTPQTIALLRHSLTVLRTQRDEGDNITALSRDLNLITRTLRGSDHNLRRVIQGTPGTARQLNALLKDLQPTLPVLLGNAVGINQVMDWHLSGLEQLLVTFPRTIASGFTGTPRRGGGRVNIQYSNKVQPCTKGYKPKNRWRPATDLRDTPVYPAHCASGPPYNMRGSKYAPGSHGGGGSSSARYYRSTWDPATGLVDGIVDAHGRRVRYRDPGNLSVLGNDSWKWLLVGTVVTQ
jgi:phospholipid/cholesterol/gamma-HCH transport system substrate-binding protein